MNSDIRISTGYPDHPKVRKLLRRLGAEGIKSHIFLLCKVGYLKTKGVLHDFDVDVIEDTAQWTGERGKFVEVLMSDDIRLLELKDGVYQIHDWEYWNPWACGSEERSDQASKAAKARWAKYRKGKANGDAPPEPEAKPPPQPRKPAKKAAAKSSTTKPPDDPPAAAGGGQLEVRDEGAKAPAKMGEKDAPPNKAADQVLQGWNKMAKRKGLKTARRLNPGRRSKINNRLKDKGWDWQGALNHLEKTLPDREKIDKKEASKTFLQGGGPAFKENGDSWTADFDFFIRGDSVDKILDGKYDPSPGGLTVMDGGMSKRNQDTLEEHQAGTNWASRKEARLRGDSPCDS